MPSGHSVGQPRHATQLPRCHAGPLRSASRQPPPRRRSPPPRRRRAPRLLHATASPRPQPRALRGCSRRRHASHAGCKSPFPPCWLSHDSPALSLIRGVVMDKCRHVDPAWMAEKGMPGWEGYYCAQRGHRCSVAFALLRCASALVVRCVSLLTPAPRAARKHAQTATAARSAFPAQVRESTHVTPLQRSSRQHRPNTPR